MSMFLGSARLRKFRLAWLSERRYSSAKSLKEATSEDTIPGNDFRRVAGPCPELSNL